MSRVPITVNGAERLRAELQQLKSVRRPESIKEIATARAHGDLKENAEYHAAKEAQSFLEGRIAELEGNLSNAELIDPSSVNAGGRVVFGATVDLINVDSGEEVTFQLVGQLEADISAGLISINSPIARSLIGKVEADEAIVRAPSGEIVYEVVEVRYG
jgi:transcription elongation factor GreA